MPRKRNVRSLITAATIIGIISSIVSCVLSLMYPGWALTILIGFVGLACTLLVDFTISFRETDTRVSENINELQNGITILVQNEVEEIKEVVELGTNLAKDAILRKNIGDIVDICEEVKRLNIDVFTRKVDEYLKNCRKLINNLADGEEDLESEFSFRPEGKTTEVSVARIVMSAEPSYLHGAYARNMLDALKYSISHGRIIVLIWLQDKDILNAEKYRRIILEQENIGAYVRIAEKESVPDDLEKDYGIVDEHYSYVMTFKNGIPDTDKVSANSERVRKLLNDFRQLETFSDRASDYYKQVDQAQNISKGSA